MQAQSLRERMEKLKVAQASLPNGGKPVQRDADYLEGIYEIQRKKAILRLIEQRERMGLPPPGKVEPTFGGGKKRPNSRRLGAGKKRPMPLFKGDGPTRSTPPGSSQRKTGSSTPPGKKSAREGKKDVRE